VEFLYQHLDTATLPNNVLHNFNLVPANNDMACPGETATACAQIKNMNNLAVTARIHKDFLP
jgi:hypothetical protein